jgi:WD40 repeat protein
MFASGSLDGDVRVWDMRNPSGSVFKLERTNRDGILALDWSLKGLLAGGKDGKIDIWRGQTGQMTKFS